MKIGLLLMIIKAKVQWIQTTLKMLLDHQGIKVESLVFKVYYHN